ncbi:MAG: type II secretion system secretin GspD [Halioglobus sp.]
MKKSKSTRDMGIILKQALVSTVMASMLLSCAAFDNQQSTEDAVVQTEEASTPPVPASTPAEPKALSESVVELAQNEVEEGDLVQPVIYRGTDRQFKQPATKEPIRFVGEDVSLNFEQAPLSEVTHAIMSDILGLDYVIDNAITGNVTLRTRTPIPRNELLKVLESLLKANRVIMIRGDDNRYLITGSAQASKLSPGISSPKNLSAGFSTIIAPLRYISASNMAAILKPVADESAFVRVDNTRNLLMLAGTQAQLEGWMDMISTFDVDLLKGMSVGLFPLENTTVEEMNEALTGLLGGKEGAGSELANLVRIVPVERLNSILVVTPRAHYLDQVGLWMKRLDTRPHSNFDKRLFVYPVQNTTAERLAKLLTSIYAEGASVTRGSVSRSTEVAPGLSPETLGSAGSSAGGSGAGSGGSGSAAIGQFSLGDVRVVADEDHNALMIYATGKDYKNIESALSQLDIVPTQVIIEASILEVTLTDDLKYGLEWTFKNGLGDDYSGLGELASTAAGPAASFPGFAYTVTNSLGDISAVLNALSSKSLLNVISTPSVMVLDNHEAEIHVGDQIPIFSAQTITDGGRTTQSVEYRDTGVKLSVKPSVNAGGLVTMDVAQSTTDVGAIDPATGQRSFLERNINSRVAVRSGESVVLGGLIRENAKKGDAGVPFLHTIPVLGSLFGTTETNDTRTELLVIITPRVMFDASELREVSSEMRSQMRYMELIDDIPMRLGR